MTYLFIFINGHPVCPDCYGNDFITDLFHDETYCSKCGLVVKDNSIGSIRTEQYLKARQDKIDAELNDYFKSHDDDRT